MLKKHFIALSLHHDERGVPRTARLAFGGIGPGHVSWRQSEVRNAAVGPGVILRVVVGIVPCGAFHFIQSPSLGGEGLGVLLGEEDLILLERLLEEVVGVEVRDELGVLGICLLYTSPSPRD